MPGFRPKKTRRKKRRKKTARPSERVHLVSKPSHIPQPNMKHPLSQREVIHLQSTLGNRTVQRLLNEGTLQLAKDDTLQREEDGLSAERLAELKAINQARRDYETIAMIAVTESATHADLIQAISMGSMLLAQLTMWFERGPSTAEIDTTLLNLAAATQDFVESLRDEVIAEEESMKFYEKELQKLNAQYSFLKPAEAEDVMDDTITEQIGTEPAQSPPQLKGKTSSPIPIPAITSEKISQIHAQVSELRAMLQKQITDILKEPETLEPLKAKMEEMEDTHRIFFKKSSRLSSKEGGASQQQDRQIQDARAEYEKKKTALQKQRLEFKAKIKMKRAAARNA